MVNDTLHLLFKNVHKTNHVVQAESTQTCGLHTIYFIVCMMDPKNTTKPIVNVNVGQYVRDHYDTSSKNASLKDKDIVKHLSKKFKTNFDMLLKAPQIDMYHHPKSQHYKTQSPKAYPCGYGVNIPSSPRREKLTPFGEEGSFKNLLTEHSSNHCNTKVSLTRWVSSCKTSS